MKEQIDNFLDDPQLVRDLAINAEYEDWLGPDGQVYKRISRVINPEVMKHILLPIIDVVGPIDLLGMGFRLNYGNEIPNTTIHTDLGWGSHALVIYLNDTQEDLGGTAFWTHRATGTERIDPGDVDLFEIVKNDWDNEEAWDMKEYVPMKFNRATIYESAFYHSRYPFDAFGSTPEDGRLIAVAFFTPHKE